MTERRRCKAVNSRGERDQCWAMPGSDYCRCHAPRGKTAEGAGWPEAIRGEHGPEIVHLPEGASVTPSWMSAEDSLRAQVAAYERVLDALTRCLCSLAWIQMDKRLARLRHDSAEACDHADLDGSDAWRYFQVTTFDYNASKTPREALESLIAAHSSLIARHEASREKLRAGLKKLDGDDGPQAR